MNLFTHVSMIYSLDVGAVFLFIVTLSKTLFKQATFFF